MSTSAIQSRYDSIMTKCPPQIQNLNQYNNRFGECKRRPMSRKIICFLHDIVESFSSMINVAFVIFWNSPTASSIVPWQIFKLRFIDGDARSTPSQTPISVTDNGNPEPGAVGIPHSPRLPCDMEKSTTCTNRNAQSTPLTFKSRADRIMTACNRS